MSNPVKKTRWRLWIYLTLGSFGFIGFWYVSKKMGDKKALKLGFIFLIVNIVAGGVNLFPIQIACFVAQIYFAIELNARYLTFLGQAPEIVHEHIEEPSRNIPGISINYSQKNDYLVEVEENFAEMEQHLDSKPAPISSQEVVSENRKNESKKISEKSAGDLIDINNVPLEILVSSIEVDARTLTRIISIRDQIGAFSSYDHLFKRADIRPHEMIKFRGKLSFGLIQNSENRIQSPSESGINRIVDL
jgi:DNA uptake protein ComE-like DNA-binding protein